MLRNPLEVTATLALALGAGVILIPGGAATAASGPTLLLAAPTAEVSYANDVAPILEKRCIRCHGGMDEGEIRVELSFDMTTYEGLMVGSEYGEVITPGDPDDSLLIEMIEEGDMPDEGDPVPAEEVAVLRQWIAEGAANN